jgi:methionine synthase I (cobalamin-dependent)
VRLDGGLATTLQARGLPPNTPVDDWLLERPDEIAAVHRAFADAGAEIVLTGTFRTFPSLRADWEAVADAALAATTGVPAAVWASIGPGARPGEWARLARRLAPGVRGYALETFVDPVECAAAVREVREVTDLPIVGSLVPGDDGLLIRGGEPGPAFDALREAGATRLGFNCGSPAGTEAAVARAACDWVKPNSGGLSQEALVASLVRLSRRVAYVGGCCGVGPHDIAAVRVRMG